MEPQLVRGLSEQIVERLREDIFSGRIAEGERLREVELAERFAVSRGPIRDALRQLSWEGVVLTDRNRGAQVAASAPNEIQELIIPLRRTTEGYAVRLFFDNLTQADFDHWDAILERMKKACIERDFATASEMDISFHRYLVERSDSPDLLAIWSSIVARVGRHFRESHLRYDDPLEIYHEHTPLIESFKNGNLNQAINILEEHIR